MPPIGASFILAFGIMGLACAAVQSAAPGPKVVLVIADYLALSDLIDGPPPAIARLVAQGGVGLIAPGAANGKPVESAYVTAGAGAYCWGDEALDQAYTASETTKDEPDSAGTIFKRRTGQTRAPAVVHLEMPLLGAENEERYAVSLPGALADALYRAGSKTALFGNSDLAGVTRRRAAAIAANRTGAVALGDVSARVLRRQPFSPTGFVTDSARLASAVNAALGSADLVVADFGDTARVELGRRELSARAYEAHRRRAMANLDDFLSRLLAGRAARATVILASIAPPLSQTGRPARLAPMLIRWPGGVRGGLISATTRTPGLVSPADIAPTVLAGLGLNRPGNMIGMPITVLAGQEDRVRRLDGVAAMNRELLWPVLGVLGALGIGAATVVCLAIAFGRTGAGFLGSVLRAMLVFAASPPLAMIFGTIGEAEIGPYVARLAIWMVVLTAASFAAAAALSLVLGERIRRLPGGLPFLALAAATSIVIFLDACRGGQLIRFTLFNAGQFDGYRFYGVGNEYMGVWLGMALVSIVWLRELCPGWESRRAARVILLLVCFATVAAIGFPQFGANAGGAVAAVVGLGLVYISGVRRSFGAPHVALLTAAGFALVAAIGLLDLAMSRGSPSHIGLTASMSAQGGYNYLLAMAARKFAMNLRLVGTPQGQVAIFGSVPFLVLWLAGVGRKVDGLVAERLAFRYGIFAALIAAAAACLFNDSGFVAGGLVCGFVVLAVIYSVLGSKPCRG